MAASNEGQHAPTADPWWAEYWDLTFVDDATGLCGFVRLTSLPNQGVSWFWTALSGPGRPLIVVVDHEVPRVGATLELRASGLWVDFICEVPFVHYTVGLEAFGLEIDDPADEVGHRVPVGYDLEWESDGADRYPLACHVTGEVLVGDEAIEVTGSGARTHQWGVDLAQFVCARPGVVTAPYVELRPPGLGLRYRRAVAASFEESAVVG